MKNHQLSLLVCLLAVAATSFAAEPLADKLPATTLVYLGWAGKTQSFDESMLGQVLAEPQLAQLLKEAVAAWARQIPDANGAESLRQVSTLMDTLWRHPLAIALLDVPPSDPKSASFVMLSDLGQDREVFDQHLQALVKTMPKPPTEQTAGGIKYYVIPGPSTTFGYKGNLLFWGMGPKLVEKLLAVQAASSLATAPKFQHCLQALGGADEQGSFYADVQTIYSLVDQAMPKPTTSEADDPVKNPFRHVLDMLGLGKVSALAGTIRVVDKGLYTRCKLFVPAPFEGVLAFANGKPISEADLAQLPEDADLAGVARFSASEMLREIRKSLANESPLSVRMLDSALAEMETTAGLSLEKDILANLGDLWTLSSATSQGGFLTGTVLSVKVKDPLKLAQAMGKLETYCDTSCKKLAVTMQDQSMGGPTWRPSCTMATTEYGKVKVRYLSSGMLMMAAPAWAIHEDTLYLSLWPQVIGDTLNREGRKPLASSPAFLAARKRLSAQPLFLSYENTPNLVRENYSSLLLLGTMGASAAKQFLNMDVSPTILPRLASMEKYVWPSAAAMSADKEGIICESYGSVPVGLLTGGPFISATGVSAMMGAVSQARGTKASTRVQGPGEDDAVISPEK